MDWKGARDSPVSPLLQEYIPSQNSFFPLTWRRWWFFFFLFPEKWIFNDFFFFLFLPFVLMWLSFNELEKFFFFVIEFVEISGLTESNQRLKTARFSCPPPLPKKRTSYLQSTLLWLPFSFKGEVFCLTDNFLSIISVSSLHSNKGR